MMKNYMTTGTFSRGKKALSPEEKAVMSIYGGPAPHESWHKLKLIDQAINALSTTVLEYLHWSESLITFN
jgi:hypothetical protein